MVKNRTASVVLRSLSPTIQILAGAGTNEMVAWKTMPSSSANPLTASRACNLSGAGEPLPESAMASSRADYKLPDLGRVRPDITDLNSALAFSIDTCIGKGVMLHVVALHGQPSGGCTRGGVTGALWLRIFRGVALGSFAGAAAALALHRLRAGIEA